MGNHVTLQGKLVSDAWITCQFGQAPSMTTIPPSITVQLSPCTPSFAPSTRTREGRPMLANKILANIRALVPAHQPWHASCDTKNPYPPNATFP
jgi:hypothetical protein